MRIRYVVYCLLLVFTGIVGCSDSSGPTPTPTPATLSGRRGHTLVYDEARHQLLLFGGQGAEGIATITDQNSLWRLDGATWTRVATSGPAPRNNASVVYDASRHVVVLYGGRSGAFPNETIFADTWEWDGAAWTQKASTGPSSRVHQSMAYDRQRSRVVLFGGFNIATQTELLDLWEWDGTSWTLKPASINATVARGIGFDEKRNALYVFTADASGAVHVDTWDGSTVARQFPTLPGCFGNPVSVGPTRGGLISVASCDASSPLQSILFDGTGATSTTIDQPSGPRFNFGVAYDRDADKAYLFGGESPQGVILGDTWRWDGTAWTKIAG